MNMFNINTKKIINAGLSQTTFCGSSMGSNQYWAGRVYGCVCIIMTVTPEGSTESGFYGEAGNRSQTRAWIFLGVNSMCLVWVT